MVRRGLTSFSVAGFALLLVLMIGLQSVLSRQLTVFGASPDFLLTLMLSAALLTDASTGACVGFVDGLAMAGTTFGQTPGTYIVTRTISGYVVGGLRRRFLPSGIFAAVLGVALGSALAGVLYGLSVPRIGVTRFIQSTFLGALYNAVLAVPVSLCLRKLGWGQ